MPKTGLQIEKIKRGVESVYSLVRSDSEFGFEKYRSDYENSCEYFKSVTDWYQAESCKIENVLRGPFARKVAGIDFGNIPEDQWLRIKNDLSEMRQICGFISGLKGVESEQARVLDYKDRFCRLFSDKDHHAAFYRVIAAIRPDLVVNVPVAAKLSAVYAWLMGVELSDGDVSDWYRMALGVRRRLQELLPEKTIYQVGVFSWHIADAFRPDRELNDTQKSCKRKVLERLRDEGLLK